MRTRLLLLLALALASLVFACGSSTEPTASDAGSDAAADAPPPSVPGLHQNCPPAGCASGQECVTAAAAGGPTSTCEIKCKTDAECPPSYKCAIPPVVPGQLPNVCI
jgi:hypothetical protein